MKQQKFNDMVCQSIFDDAKNAATKAIKENINKIDCYPCGFAHIQMPKTGNFAKFLIKKNLANFGHMGGLRLCYSLIDDSAFEKNRTMSQSMILKEIGLEAALKIFNDFGVVSFKTYVHTRID